MPGIRLEHVSFSYPNGFLAVEDIDITISQGEKVAILGQNGAGKTTTVKMMNNLCAPTKGDVWVGEKNTKKYTTAQISHDVGYVFQNPDDQIFHSTVYNEVEFGPKASLNLSEEEVKQRTEDALRVTGLYEERHNNPYNLPLSIRKFVTIASVLAVNNEVMILDEPTAGQDLRGINMLSSLVETMCDQGKTIITITHDIEFAVKNFDRIILMANKHVIKDRTVKEVFSDSEALKEAMLRKPYAGRMAQHFNLSSTVLSDDEVVDELMKKYNNKNRME